MLNTARSLQSFFFEVILWHKHVLMAENALPPLMPLRRSPHALGYELTESRRWMGCLMELFCSAAAGSQGSSHCSDVHTQRDLKCSQL